MNYQIQTNNSKIIVIIDPQRFPTDEDIRIKTINSIHQGNKAHPKHKGILFFRSLKDYRNFIKYFEEDQNILYHYNFEATEFTQLILRINGYLDNNIIEGQFILINKSEFEKFRNKH
jgi:gluconate kinase